MVHVRGGYSFLIKAGQFERPLGPLKFYARVDRAVRHDGGPSELPFVPAAEHWGATEAEAVAHAVKEIDDWFAAHPPAST